MATATARRIRVFGPESNGILLTPRQFDHAEFADGWRYELINGVLIVSPIPSLKERDPNEELGFWLRNYQEGHPQGTTLDFTIYEHTVKMRRNRRRADRVLWTGLGRLPTAKDVPSIIAEFVSARRRHWKRDYEVKRDEYLELRVQEYWVIDRFERTLTVFTLQAGKVKKRLYREHQTYRTELLPGFELPLARLFALADRWPEEESPSAP